MLYPSRDFFFRRSTLSYGHRSLAVCEADIRQQSLYLKVREIALRYPEEFNLRNRYVAAAKRFRLPYWDPMLVRYVPRTGTNGPWHCGIPKVLGAGQVRVRTPKDPHMLSNINNPLYCYQFPSKYKYDNKPPFDWKGFWGNKSSTKLRYTSNMFTNRGPDLNGSPNNRRVTQNSSRDPLARREIADFLRQQGARIEKMFFVPKPDAITQAEAYGLFATSAYWSNARTGADKIQFQKYADSSIEEFHGAVHGIIGRGEDPNQTYALRGHMGVVPYSSFDPIFWLHHWYAHSSIRLQNQKVILILLIQQHRQINCDLATREPGRMGLFLVSPRT